MSVIQMVGTAWLFHVGKKYYITHDFDDDLCDLSLGAIPIDELIAESVVTLCNKGYIIRDCCSGHPYNSCKYTVLENQEKKNVKAESHVAITHFLETDAIVVCDIEKEINDEAYISFVNNYKLSSIPEGWTYSGNTLRNRITAESTIEFYKKLIITLEKLMVWINSLPSV